MSDYNAEDAAIGNIFKGKLGRPDLTPKELEENWDALMVKLAINDSELDASLVNELDDLIGKNIIRPIERAAGKFKTWLCTEITGPMWKLIIFGVACGVVSGIIDSIRLLSVGG